MIVMRTLKFRFTSILVLPIIIFAALLAGCGVAAPAVPPTPVPPPTDTPAPAAAVPTDTPLPTSTPAPTLLAPNEPLFAASLAYLRKPDE